MLSMVAHAAHQQVQRRGAPGDEQAVDDVAVVLLADGDGHQADLLGEGQDLLEDTGSVPGWPMTSPMLASHTPMAKCRARKCCGRSTKPHQRARRQGRGVGREHGARGGMPRRLAPEGLLDVHGLGNGLADQIGVAHRRRQVARVREPSERVVDLVPSGAAPLDEELRVLAMKCPARSRPAGMAS